MPNASSTTSFAYDGTDLVAEYDATNAMTKRYVFGAATDEPIVWYEEAGATDRRWLVADERGSVVVVTDGAGNSLVTNTYEEYGIPGSANSGPVYRPSLASPGRTVSLQGPFLLAYAGSLYANRSSR